MFAADIDSAVMAALKDGRGDYIERYGGTGARDIELIVDHGLQRAGPEGQFLTDAIGITWRKSDLARCDIGGVFVFERCRYVVEDIISDDGSIATAACMVQK